MKKIVVLDDKGPFVESVVALLKSPEIEAIGYKTVEEFRRAARSGALESAGLIFLDMDLGDESGVPVTAIDVMPFARTYSKANVLIFTHKGIALEDCVECVRLGALGLIPKTPSSELLFAARVYEHVGDDLHTREAVIGHLWTKLNSSSTADKGALFEMLVANLLSTIDGLFVEGNNWQTPSGEIDIILRNEGADAFWQELNSYHIIVECKNRKDPAETSDFAVFKAKVRAKGACQVGIMASWTRPSTGYRNLQATTTQEERIFLLLREDIQALIDTPPAEREPHLRRLLSRQL